MSKGRSSRRRWSTGGAALLVAGCSVALFQCRQGGFFAEDGGDAVPGGNNEGDGGGGNNGVSADGGAGPDGRTDRDVGDVSEVPDGSGDGGTIIDTSTIIDTGTTTARGATWVLIDVSGTPFTVGSPEGELTHRSDEVEHAVTLTHDFWMMTTEITQQQYLDDMGYNPSYFSGCGMDCPVERVNWHEMAAYANALSALEGFGECYSCTGTAPDTIDCAPSGSYTTAYDCPGYRLPTEAEWEYAARGGTTTSTHAGDQTATDCTDTTVDQIAWFCGNASSTTHPVATKTENAYGLYDMLGNVWEWCHDWYADYPGGAETDPTGPPSGTGRVLRGGSWGGLARDLRAATRHNFSPGNPSWSVGARFVRSGP